MESVKEFLSKSYGGGSTCNLGYVYGHGRGDGSGSGYGFVDGSGSGYDYRSGSGYGYSDGSGFGFGNGNGNGYDSGSGSSYNEGNDIKKYNNDVVYFIDRVPTAIKKVVNNIARGYIVNDDLTTTPCYIAKVENCFAHGETAHEAVCEAQSKAFEKLTMEERIEEFWKYHNKVDKYPMRDFYEWHNKLTGSCKMGRDQFVKDHGLDLDNDYFTVDEFIKLCENDYGGEIVKRLKR